jgi:serine/threonine-protein kinase
LAERYVLESPLAYGGMAEVWRAHHLTLNKDVAIKVLHGPTTARKQQRFLVEARITEKVRSPYAVRVFDYGVTDDGRAYLVMELIDGETMSDAIAREGHLSPWTTVHILQDAATALDEAHALGIVHRDFKPSNVMLVHRPGEPPLAKVFDFGIAKLLGELGEAEEGLTLTPTGCLPGTPQYMAPEQIGSDEGLDGKVDVWALGVVAFECLTGQVPFDSHDLKTLLRQIAERRHVAATKLNPSLPHSFDAWFARACAIEPAHRFATAGSAVAALREALAGVLVPTEIAPRSWPRRPPGAGPTTDAIPLPLVRPLSGPATIPPVRSASKLGPAVGIAIALAVMAVLLAAAWAVLHRA